MAKNRNKVKFGLNNVHWAKIIQWGVDPDGSPNVPVYGESVRLPGAVSLSIDANGENENFYADDSVYYVINNNSGYEGDLEVALVTTEFATEILGEILDNNGVLVVRRAGLRAEDEGRCRRLLPLYASGPGVRRRQVCLLRQARQAHDLLGRGVLS